MTHHDSHIRFWITNNKPHKYIKMGINPFYMTCPLTPLRVNIGSSPSLNTSLPLFSPNDANGSGVNWNAERTHNMFIGSSSSLSSESAAWPGSDLSSVMSTPSLPDPVQLWTTFGRTTQPLPTPDSNWDSPLYEEMRSRIGTRSGNMQSPVISRIYQQVSEYPPTPPFPESPRTTSSPLLWRELSPFTWDLPEWVNQDGLGRPQVGGLTLRTLTPSSGTGTEDRSTLLWTSSEERSIYPTSCDGLIDTPCPSRQRVQEQSSTPKRSGSPATSIQNNGTQTSIKRQKLR